MFEWVNWAAEQVDLIANGDSFYQQSLSVQQALVDEFERIVMGLPEIEKDLILDYLNAVTEMEYRKSQLAYQLGKQVGQKKKE